MNDSVGANRRDRHGGEMGRFKGSLAIATALMCCFAAAGCSKPNKEEQVREAFHVYMDAWKKGDLESVWKLMSVRLKRGNDNSIENFRNFIQHQGFAPLGYKVERVEVADKTAQVRAEIQFHDSRGREIGKEREDCQFIFTGNRWYFHDCKPSSADK